MSSFKQRKQKILEQLSTPVESYADASPKGSIDEGIIELVDEINRLDGLVTTSSCAGRIAVYQEGLKSKPSSDEDNAQSSSSLGKGGGKWLFVSHEPVVLQDTAIEGAISTMFCLPTPSKELQFMASSNSHYVHFKFEPMIARKTLAAALAAGFRESGISSINDEQDSVMVAIRSSGLAFDSLVASFNAGDDHITPMVSEIYLQQLVEVANQRFVVNSSRKERFRIDLLASFNGGAQKAKEGPAWEPAEERRERKRAEGLQRREELRTMQQRTAKTDESDEGMAVD